MAKEKWLYLLKVMNKVMVLGGKDTLVCHADKSRFLVLRVRGKNGVHVVWSGVQGNVPKVMFELKWVGGA